nr:protein ENHANCED DISEASE RESISTANCE 2-like isoform X2 [Ipomoea trifida]
MSSKVVYEGWMVRYGRRKIGRSYIHTRYFVLESRLLAYYKKKPESNNVVPVKTLMIDGNCRVEDRGLKTHHGHMVYVLSVYNKKVRDNRFTMASFNIQEALTWKAKIESVIDLHQDSLNTNDISFEYKPDMERNGSSSDHESQFSAAEDDEEDDSNRELLRRSTIGQGPPESILDWTKELGSDSANQNAKATKYWRLLQCQNGLRIFEEQVDAPKSCKRAMKAVGVVEASCEEIFELVMSMDTTRFEWDCTFQYGSLVEEVDGHTAILYHRLQLDWFPMFVWPRDLCYVRYWRRNDDGTYGGGFTISPQKSRHGIPRTKVQYLMQIDLKGWVVGHLSSFKQHCLFQMLNSVAGLREYFSQTDERTAAPGIPAMVDMASVSSKRNQKLDEDSDPHHRSPSLDQMTAANKNAAMLDEDSDEDEEFQVADQEEQKPLLENEVKKTGMLTVYYKSFSYMYIYHQENTYLHSYRFEAPEEETTDQIDFSIFSGNLQHDDRDDARNSWKISEGDNFKVRSKNFCQDKSKAPGGKHMMDLVAVDWFKDTKRMDNVARRPGCAAQVASEKGLFSFIVNLQIPGSTHYSMVFYFVTKELVPSSLFQRFVDGDDEFRNSRLKLIPAVPKGSWIVRQSVGSAACLLGKAVDCNYSRGPKYLEVDVDIGSSTVANGVLGLVIGVITTLVVDMAFLLQGNTPDELPERLLGAIRLSHIELSSAVVLNMESDTATSD